METRSNPLRRAAASALLSATATLVLFVAAAGSASATGPIGTPTQFDGDFSCTDFDTAGLLTEMDINPVPDGPNNHDDGVLNLDTILYDSTGGWLLDWIQNTTGQSIHHVIVKGDTGGNYYTYDPPVTGDRGLHALLDPPVPPFNAKYEAITRATFCYSVAGTGFEGCTLGYWKVKQHHDSWPAPYSTDSSLQTHFGGSAFDASFLAALNFKGGPGVDGGKRILLKQAVASLLNAASGDVTFPLSQAQVITMTTFALNTGDRDVMISLAATLDAYNNQGCPLN